MFYCLPFGFQAIAQTGREEGWVVNPKRVSKEEFQTTMSPCNVAAAMKFPQGEYCTIEYWDLTEGQVSLLFSDQSTVLTTTTEDSLGRANWCISVEGWKSIRPNYKKNTIKMLKLRLACLLKHLACIKLLTFGRQEYSFNNFCVSTSQILKNPSPALTASNFPSGHKATLKGGPLTPLKLNTFSLSTKFITLISMSSATTATNYKQKHHYQKFITTLILTFTPLRTAIWLTCEVNLQRIPSLCPSGYVTSCTVLLSVAT